MRDLDSVAERKPGQDCGQKHGCGLSGDNQLMPVDPVSGGASERRKQENRNLAGEPDRAQLKRGFRNAIDEPRLRHTLHPSAGQGDDLTAKEELEVAVAEGAERGVPPGRG